MRWRARRRERLSGALHIVQDEGELVDGDGAIWARVTLAQGGPMRGSWAWEWRGFPSQRGWARSKEDAKAACEALAQLQSSPGSGPVKSTT
ncbi:MAG: hypothetical protein HZY79_15765 [Rhodoblastus sp.]|nr:MAG: hypothetical protein HZY79_15765 [Rhodoblastus sp.]